MPSLFGTITSGNPLTTYHDTTGADTKEYLELPESGTWVTMDTTPNKDMDVYYLTAGGNGKKYVALRRPHSISH